MAVYIQDNFDDNVINTDKITTFGDADVVETGGRLVTPAAGINGKFTIAYSATRYDLTKGRLCAQLTKTGTVTGGNIYVYFGVRDPNNKVYTQFGDPNSSQLLAGTDELGASTTNTNNDTTVGVGPTWPADTYLGYSYTESTRTFVIEKSTNLTTWTPIRTIVVTTPSFLFRRAGVVLGAVNYNATTRDFKSSWNNLTYVSNDVAQKVRVYFNGGWVYASVKTRTSTNTWVKPITRVRKTSAWWQPS